MSNPPPSPSPRPTPPVILNNGAETNQGHWWETYVIRYFVGTIVGGAILLFLNNNEKSSLKGNLLPGIKNLEALDASQILVIAAVGFVYCYIASAPILVLHASRAAFLQTDDSKIKLAIYISVLSVIGIWLYGLFFTSYTSDSVTSLSLLILFLAIQFIPLIAASIKRGKISHDFYVQLTSKRANQDLANKEYVQSYRHLREHGNAFLILFFEGVLGVILSGLSNPVIALFCLLIWIIPAALVWAHGTMLEAKYAGLY